MLVHCLQTMYVDGQWLYSFNHIHAPLVFATVMSNPERDVFSTTVCVAHSS